MTSRASLLPFLLTGLLAGCSAIVSPNGADIHDPDPGADASADGGVDSTVGDSGSTDTGAVDSGTTDTGTVDSGTVDSATMDSGAMDSGTTDTGTMDSGTVDSGTTCPADCALGCPPGLTRCYEVVPSNVPATLFDPGASDLVVSGDATRFLDTSTCAAMTVASHVVTDDSGQQYCVLVVGDVRIDPAATLVAAGDRPMVILAYGDVDIQGTLDVSATQDEPGPGGGLGGVGDPRSGRGPSGGEGGEHQNSVEDGGGGGGGLCGAGGDGGDGGRARGGRGGTAISSTWDLQPLTGGSGGGRGRGSFAGGTTNAGFGGAGGGAVQITSRGSILVEGAILAGGGGGLPGDNRFSFMSNWGSGGGGGSGGAILLEAPFVNVTGALLDAAGGGGGAIGDSAGAGEAGMDGRDTLDRAAGGAPIGMAGAGGDGGGATTLSGNAGESLRGSPVNGGGGGGGAGCVLVRNGDGSLPVVGIATPSVSPGYRSMVIQRR